MSRLKLLEKALERCYELAHKAWNEDRFGPSNSDEAKELRREVAGVLRAAGVEHPLGWDYGDTPPDPAIEGLANLDPLLTAAEVRAAIFDREAL